MPVDDVEQAALDKGLLNDQSKVLAGDYGDAQLDGRKRAIGAIAVIGLLSLWFTRRLPGRPLQEPKRRDTARPERPAAPPTSA